jgi:hypothetical protein
VMRLRQRWPVGGFTRMSRRSQIKIYVQSSTFLSVVYLLAGESDNDVYKHKDPD